MPWYQINIMLFYRETQSDRQIEKEIRLGFSLNNIAYHVPRVYP